MVKRWINLHEILDKIEENIRLRKMRADIGNFSAMDRDTAIKSFLSHEIGQGASEIAQLIGDFYDQRKRQKEKAK